MKSIKIVAILGVGLIGGSIALALKQRMKGKITVCGSCGNPRRAQLAQTKGFIDEVINTPKQLQKADIIILAAPIPKTLKLLKDLTSLQLKKEVLVIDIASVKNVIEETVSRTDPHFHFIGTHPMAGGEKKGFENADPDLFVNKPWIITPMNRNSQKEMAFLTKIIKDIGAIPMMLTAKAHDEQVAWASHLSLILSSLLVRNLEENSQWTSVKKLVSTGFFDMTRLASHNPSFKTDLILNNKENLLISLRKFREEINYFEQLINLSGKKDIHEYLTHAKKTRDDLFNNSL